MLGKRKLGTVYRPLHVVLIFMATVSVVKLLSGGAPSGQPWRARDTKAEEMSGGGDGRVSKYLINYY